MKNIDDIKYMALAAYKLLQRANKLTTFMQTDDYPYIDYSIWDKVDELYEGSSKIPYCTTFWYLFEDRFTGKRYAGYGDLNRPSMGVSSLMELIDDNFYYYGVCVHNTPYGIYSCPGHTPRYDKRRFKVVHQTKVIRDKRTNEQYWV